MPLTTAAQMSGHVRFWFIVSFTCEKTHTIFIVIITYFIFDWKLTFVLVEYQIGIFGDRKHVSKN